MLQFKIFQQFRSSLRHAVLPRETEFENFRMDGRAPVFFKTQLHGTKIVIAKSHVIASERKQAKQSHKGDALATSEINLPLLIRVADCASILLFDPEKRVIANIHAGWRGLAKKIIGKTIVRLRKKFATKPEKLFAAISPMIGPCCCLFSDPRRELPRHMHKYILGETKVSPTYARSRYARHSRPLPFIHSQREPTRPAARSFNVDLWAAAENQLTESGISTNHIENPRICTFCSPQKFPSFRRDKNSARFATVIMLR